MLCYINDIHLTYTTNNIKYKSKYISSTSTLTESAISEFPSIFEIPKSPSLANPVLVRNIFKVLISLEKS